MNMCFHDLKSNLNMLGSTLLLTACVCGAGFCLALACVLFPDSWACAEMRALCGERVSSFSPGNCSVHWAYILALLGVLDAAILATLAFVLGNRQDALLPEDAKDGDGKRFTYSC